MMILALGPRQKLWNSIDKTKSGMIYVCFEYKEGLHNLVNHFKISHRLNSSSSIYECIHCKGLKLYFLLSLYRIYYIHYL